MGSRAVGALVALPSDFSLGIATVQPLVAASAIFFVVREAIGSSPRSSGRRNWLLGPQAVDEIGEANLALTPQPLGGNDRLDLRDALLNVAVDDHIIVLRPMAHFFAGFG
jgi:hypothetical protein